MPSTPTVPNPLPASEWTASRKVKCAEWVAAFFRCIQGRGSYPGSPPRGYYEHYKPSNPDAPLPEDFVHVLMKQQSPSPKARSAAPPAAPPAPSTVSATAGMSMSGDALQVFLQHQADTLRDVTLHTTKLLMERDGRRSRGRSFSDRSLFSRVGPKDKHRAFHAGKKKYRRRRKQPAGAAGTSDPDAASSSSGPSEPSPDSLFVEDAPPAPVQVDADTPMTDASRPPSPAPSSSPSGYQPSETDTRLADAFDPSIDSDEVFY